MLTAIQSSPKGVVELSAPATSALRLRAAPPPSGAGAAAAISRDRRIQLLLVVNVLLQIGDGWATTIGLRRGMGEGNPLIVGLMELVGTEPALWLTKLVALLGLALLYACRRHPFVEPGLISLAVVYTLLSIVPWTVLLVMT